MKSANFIVMKIEQLIRMEKSKNLTKATIDPITKARLQGWKEALFWVLSSHKSVK